MTGKPGIFGEFIQIMNQLFFNILPDEQKKVYEILKGKEWINSYYLAGGTGLALQLGHRLSKDFDFFSPLDFSTPELVQMLNELGEFQKHSEDINTLHGSLNGTRLSFIGFKYPVIQDKINDHAIRIAGLGDIAAMKLSAVLSRGIKKDFIDL